MIDQNIDLPKQNLLKNHVDHMHWPIDKENEKDHDVAPLNAILDQLHGRDYGQSWDLKILVAMSFLPMFRMIMNLN